MRLDIDSILAAHGIGSGGGTATVADVLSPYTFTSNTGFHTGTMPNQGSPALQPGQSIPAGYYSGGSVDSATEYQPTVSGGTYSGSATTWTITANIPINHVMMLFTQFGSGVAPAWLSSDLGECYYGPTEGSAAVTVTGLGSTSVTVSVPVQANTYSLVATIVSS